MKMLVRYLASLVSTLMEVATELREIRNILSNEHDTDIAVTAKQAAKIVGCSESKVNKLYKNGVLHKYVIGGKRGFSIKELKNL